MVSMELVIPKPTTYPEKEKNKRKEGRKELC
jgi:hypothetical protein